MGLNKENPKKKSNLAKDTNVPRCHRGQGWQDNHLTQRECEVWAESEHPLFGMGESQEILDALGFVSRELATTLQILGMILYLHLFIYTQLCISVTAHI